ncbi:Pkinase-domain-containing protein [Obba rivulosa]|uniref:Pkinase-domain-containing protein n=1 Tax=Obba rivulosa TaxID=1052685 RepID=A0A8E2J549_9APHY|nr:Pkinase-domain-containing protein [Obba rivulosa]
MHNASLSADGLRAGYSRNEYPSDLTVPLYDAPVSLARQPRTPPRSPTRAQGERSEKEVEIRGLRPSASRQLLREPSDSDRAEDTQRDSTSRLDDTISRFAGFIDETVAEGTAKPRLRSNLTVPSHISSSAPSELRTASISALSSTLTDSSRGLINEDYEGSGSDEDLDSDDADDNLFARKPQIDDSGPSSWQKLTADQARNGTKPTLAPLSIENSPSSTPAPLPQNGYSDASRGVPDGFPAAPNYIPVPPPHRMMKRSQAGADAPRRTRDQRTSRFDDNYDGTWAPRPPPEEMFERLEEFFPEHDLDRPLIEATSGGTSPTSAECPTPAPPRRHKKSIRVVALEQHRRRDAGTVTAQLRKRNTKLWGSRLEEVTTQQAASGLPSAASDQSPGGGAKPIFRWVRGELIGKGTYGKVYLALNATTGEMIAVKQVEMPRTASDKSDSRQVTVVEALKLESETLKDLDHPHIVQYLGFEETPTFLSIFLEYVPGGSIASCLRKHGRFDEEVTKSFTGQILSGLEYLHSKGILHRDLKADNILVETSGICKISDFGISKRTDDINMIGAYTSMQGTVFWMAPEVINPQKKGYNSKIDIWSVGCVVFEMWTGQRPWSGQEAMAVLLHLYNTKQSPPVPDEVTLSPVADDFRRQCFAMDPDERPTAAELRLHPYLELQPGWTFNGFK